MELANIPRLVQDLQGRDDYDSYKKFWDQYLASLSARGPADFKRDKEKYLEDTRIYRGLGLEGNVRRILEFCGLPFEPACLEFYKTGRSVHTVSSEQVRRPFNREGIDQWRHFEPGLAPLRHSLGPLATP
jgi:hypothetical protein